jgi:DNA invertase Pin-like site-specific DNA recombinase
MIFGYARVSTEDQNLSLQLDALKSAGCDRIFSEKKSGAKDDRAELIRLLDQVREGDTIMVWKLDRLGRSLHHLVATITDLNTRGVAFRSLRESIDTTSATGKLIFHIFASLAEFERDMIRERTNAGLASARARGRVGGRPEGLSPTADLKANAAKALYQDGNSLTVIMTQLGIKSKETLYRWLRLKGVEIGKKP